MTANKLTTYFKTNLKFKVLCIDMLSRHYAFSNKQIVAHKEILNFKESYLVYNKNIVWNLQTLETVKNKIDWRGFYTFEGVELNLSFFKKYESYINFRSIQLNQNVDWSNELLDNYAESWDWENLMHKHIITLPRNIEKYSDKYNWDKFSFNMFLNLSDVFLEKYEDKWNWKILSRNKNFKVDKKGIKKYKDKLCFSNLSRNQSMVPFILAYPNEYDWNWSAFIQNSAVIFNDKIIGFLISKMKSDLPFLKRASEEVQNEFTKRSIINLVSGSTNFDRDFWFTDNFQKNIDFENLVRKIPKVFTTNEIEMHLNLADMENHSSYSIIQRVSKEYILKNTDTFLKLRSVLFRYGAIDQEFVKSNIRDSDWFQLSFNEQLDWSLDLTIDNIDKFESLYGLSQNKSIYKLLFGQARPDDIENLLKEY